jgi:class 3 adenylate cyclase
MAEPEAPHVRGFLFADLRGFTQFVETHGDQAASELLTAYRTLVRASVARFSGAEIRTEGDGFYVVFPSPSSAIRCALAILEEAAQSTAAAGGPLQVGIGIHAGETADSAEGFVGSAVNIAARVCALAAAGELLVTETVRGLVRTSMRLSVEPRGRRHLKGIREPIPLFAIRASGVPAPSRPFRFFPARGVTRPVLAAFATLAGVAALAMVVLTVGLLTDTTANPGASQAGPVRSGTGTLAASPSPSGLGPFPNALESSLLARMDSSVKSFCRRAEVSEYPSMPKSPVAQQRYVLPVQAGLRCAPGGSAPDVVFLWAVGHMFHEPGHGAFDEETVGSFFFARVANSGAQLGDCATKDLAYQEWSFGLFSGKLLCVVTPARARIDWVYDGEDLIATAERDDGNGNALYQWWLDEGRSILH